MVTANGRKIKLKNYASRQKFLPKILVGKTMWNFIIILLVVRLWNSVYGLQRLSVLQIQAGERYLLKSRCISRDSHGLFRVPLRVSLWWHFFNNFEFSKYNFQRTTFLHFRERQRQRVSPHLLICLPFSWSCSISLSRVFYRASLHQHPSWFLSPYEPLAGSVLTLRSMPFCAPFILILFSNTKIPVPSK